MTKDPYESSGELDDLPVPFSLQQCSPTPPHTTDSEMTDFEEDSSNSLTSAESDHSVLNSISNNLP
jgi:hypothetical protein